jgi:hypothetical protein
MKKWMLTVAAFLMAGAVSAEILISWDGSGSKTPTNETLNINGILFGTQETTLGASNDGWYGPDNVDDGGHAGADTTTMSGFKVSASGTQVDVKITNNSGQDLDLATLVFDYQSIWADGPQKVEVLYAYGALAGISDNTLLVTLDAPGHSSKLLTDFSDFVVDLKASLTDYTLADGQSATFIIRGADASDSGANGIVDNIAFLDTFPAPDPVTVFKADFEGSTASDPTASNLTTNNLNAGTAIGSWEIDADGGGNSTYAAVITNSTGTAKALMLATDNYDATAVLDSIAPLEGTTVSLDAYLRNVANDAPVNRIIGLDSGGLEVFEIILSGYNTSGDPSYRSVGYSDASDTVHYLGENLLDVQQNDEYNLPKNRNLLLTLGAASMDIAWNGSSLTNSIAFKDVAATDLAEIRFVGDSASGWEGMVYDSIEVIMPYPTGFAPWIALYDLSGPDAEPDYDYDGDGWDNLMEYALGGDPTDGILDGEIPTATMLGGTMEYVYSMRTDDLSLTYYLELRDNLTIGTWSNMGYTVTGTNVSGGLFDQVTNSVLTTETKKFIRLTVEN